MMVFLRISRLWNYVSPRKTQQRRDKEFKVPAIPVKRAPLSRQAAPPASQDNRQQSRNGSHESQHLGSVSRAKLWIVRTPSPHSSFDGDAELEHTLQLLSPPSSTKGLDLDSEAAAKSPSAQSPSVTGSSGSSGNEVDANEDTILVDDGNYLGRSIDVDKERERREHQGRQLREAGWSEDAVFLFQKLGMRGLEPLLPIEWINDLETLPEDLFTARIDKAFLRPAHGNGFRAQQALRNLFDLGGRVRDAKYTKAQKRRPEYHINRAVQQYATWAMRDGQVDGIWAQLPLFRTVTWPIRTHASVGERAMLKKLGKLHVQWYNALGIQEAEARGDMVVPEVPTLYGVTASSTVLAFVSYAPPTEENVQPQLRLIAMFDFKKDGYDVWHALAISIFVTHCRNRMMQLKEMLPEPKVPSDPDPDL
ncbi:hypothetical protein ACEQ8H_003968 [Pleosporales sp. CAS-2024a]